MRIRIKTHRKKKQLKRDGNQINWPIAYRWAAVGTLVAYSTVGSRTINVARAQDIPGPLPANGSLSPARGSQPGRRFEIPAGSLDSMLAVFGQVSGLTISLSKKGIGSLSSPGVVGR